jgi:hypothetical protein
LAIAKIRKIMKFNSAICTSIDQSRRLLELGLKEETADMQYHIPYPMPYPIGHKCVGFPAWSLHRLIEMMPENIADDWLGVSFDEVTYYHGAGEEMIGWKFYKTGNVYNCCIDCIEWLIKEGYFNKEYLVNQAEIDEHCKGVLEYLDYIKGEEQ